MDFKLYYECPMQVKFWEPEVNGYMGGIAYRDEVICGCCGGVFLIANIVCNTPKGTTPIIAYENWIDIEHEIVEE